jgi:hypothetical protein
MSSSEYLTREIAAQRLGISERRLLDLASRGRIARKSIRDPRSGQKMYVYAAKDIGQYHDALLRTRYTQAAGPPTQSMPQTLPAGPLPQWLALPQAEEYSGLPAPYLRRLIKEGKLPAIDLGKDATGGRWRVSRKDLAGIRGATQQIRDKRSKESGQQIC